jgi:hypothetical protein
MTEALRAKLLRSVVKTETCWLWLGATNNSGYGYLSHRGRSYGVHRLAWELHNGRPIPKGFCCCHRCVDRPNCVNPSHLYLATQRENLAEMWAKGRARRQREAA